VQITHHHCSSYGVAVSLVACRAASGPGEAHEGTATPMPIPTPATVPSATKAAKSLAQWQSPLAVAMSTSTSIPPDWTDLGPPLPTATPWPIPMVPTPMPSPVVTPVPVVLPPFVAGLESVERRPFRLFVRQGIGAPRWSLDGTRVAYGDDVAGVQVIDLGDGSVTSLEGEGVLVGMAAEVLSP
jgi:hypothetical protein